MKIQPLNKTYQVKSFKECEKSNLKTASDTASFGHSKDISLVSKLFKNKIKIVFTDVDGTLSRRNDTVTEKTLSAIKKLQDKNVPVILTTARCYKDTIPILRKLPHNPDYTILLQGGEVIDRKGKLLLQNKIAPENGKKLISWAESLNKSGNDSHIILYFDNEAYATGNVQFPWAAECMVQKVKSFDELFNDNKTLQKAMLYTPVPESGLNSLKGLISSFKSFGIDDLDFQLASSGFHEIQNKSVSKDKAIDLILKKLKIEPKSTMVIGDGTNDIEMFDFINSRNGLAVAMGNADDKVKRHANAITKTIQDEGFFNTIEHLFD